MIIRDAALQGQHIYFHQLRKLIAATIFREGRAASVVNFPDITRAKELAEAFVNAHERDYSAWVGIEYLRTNKEIEEEQRQKREAERLVKEKEKARQKRAQEREKAYRKQEELRLLKRKEEEAKRAAAIAARKTAKAEHNRRQRQIKQQVKVVVLAAVQQLEVDLPYRPCCSSVSTRHVRELKLTWATVLPNVKTLLTTYS